MNYHYTVYYISIWYIYYCILVNYHNYNELPLDSVYYIVHTYIYIYYYIWYIAVFFNFHTTEASHLQDLHAAGGRAAVINPIKLKAVFNATGSAGGSCPGKINGCSISR